MSKKTLYIFIEGDDDEKFINTFIRDKKSLKEKYAGIKCVQYSQWNIRKLNAYIDVVKKQDYIILGDADFKGVINCFSSRKKELIKKYNIPDADRVWVVIEEIESWFLAGFDETFCKKESLEYKKKTEKITKEIFNKIDKKKKKKTHKQLIDFLVKKKDDFSFEEVSKRNESLMRFCKHFGFDC